ncbi:Thoeris anti-defense Tad2 family protein [Klebsiella pneumoniae]
MNFGEALSAVKSGAKIYREGWNGKGSLSLRQVDTPSANLAPAVIMQRRGSLVNLLLRHTST